MCNPTVLILLGPTAVGKTAIALAIAGKIDCEIVSADSRQVYRYMDIGTAKPRGEILKKIPHHFIDIIDPDQDYSAGQFANEARQVIRQILKKGKIALVVGGSGLYLRALLEGFFGGDIRDEKIRSRLNERLQREGAEKLFRELSEVDPPLAAVTHPNNVKRVLRGLEVYLASGIPLSQIQKKQKDPAPFAYKKFGLTMERKQLYERINHRVEEMFEQGLINEVRDLLKKGYSEKLNSLNSVGYKEAIDYLKGHTDLRTCIERVKQNTRRYAKRQFTWFRAEKDIHWVSIEPANDYIDTAAREILDQFNVENK
ncbi:MAG: tRNA (adenosine(37)-N6)-dimethylallyltransferase MiaA [Calditrichia bacterium]